MNDCQEKPPEETLIKRRIILIDRQFQLGLIFKFILLNSAMFLLFGFLVYWIFETELSAHLTTTTLTHSHFSHMLLPTVLILSLLNIIFTSVFVTVVVLHSSHKIAGPLYRFNEAIIEMANGNLKPSTQIRQHDQLKEISKNLTTLSLNLSANYSQMTEIIDDIRNLCTQTEPPPGLEAKLLKLQVLSQKFSGKSGKTENPGA
jgi:methyl-accepting chemotaxis protein